MLSPMNLDFEQVAPKPETLEGKHSKIPSILRLRNFNLLYDEQFYRTSYLPF